MPEPPGKLPPPIAPGGPAPWQPEVTVDLEGIRRRLDAEQPDLRGQPITRLGEGWDNLAVRVGDGWVFRFARRQLAAQLMTREQRWAPLVASQLPIAAAIPERCSQPGDPHPYTGHRWLPASTGCSAGLDDDARSGLAPALGAVLRVLHGLDVPPDAPLDVIGRGDHVKRGLRGMNRLLAVHGHGIDADLLRAAITPRLAVPAYAGSPRWVHGDLYGRHLLVDGEPARLAGIIDWGDLHAGDPAVDLSIAYSFLVANARPALFEAYGPVDAATRERARLVAFDYAGAMIGYGRDIGDQAAEALGWLALRCALDGA